jgi:hypothetical protein
MNIDVQTLYYSAYVAFVFAVLLFGALAFRQILDDLELRRKRVGEDRTAFLDPLATAAVLAALLLSLAIGIAVVAFHEPSIYWYALPMILGVQGLQMAARVWFQRSQVKTKGLVVRSVLFDKVKVVQFDEVGDVEFRHRTWRINVIVSTPSERVRFRIFPHSAPLLAGMIHTSCGCDVRHVDTNGQRFSTSAKNDL